MHVDVFLEPGTRTALSVFSWESGAHLPSYVRVTSGRWRQDAYTGIVVPFVLCTRPGTVYDVLVIPDGAWAPHSAVQLTVADGAIVRIADFWHTPWVLEAADAVLLA